MARFKIPPAYYRETGLEVVPEDLNPTNTPQARPIERFWALCKRAMKNKKLVAKTTRQLCSQWKRVSNEIAEKSGIELMVDLRGKITKLATEELFALLK